MRKKKELLAVPRFPWIGPARMVNGYIAYYTKYKHTIYEHDVVAELKLGRKLLRSEIAHHTNGIRHDNRDENIEVKSSSLHSSEHNTERTPIERRARYKLCVCNRLFWAQADTKYCSLSCVPRRITPGRPTLDELVQMCKNMRKSEIAKIYGVSETAIRKWLRTLR